jgi:hypothetical protein
MSYFAKISSIIKNSGTPVKYGGIGYLTCAVLYTGSSCYENSVDSLNNFRKMPHSLKDEEYYKNYGINSELMACKHGAFKNFGNIFLSSVA